MEARLRGDRGSGRVASDGASVWAMLAERTDASRWRPQLADDVETAEFAVAGGGAYVMVANPRDLVYYRFTPEEAALLPLLDGEHSIGELVVEHLTEDGELDPAAVLALGRLLEVGGFLDVPYVDVDA